MRVNYFFFILILFSFNRITAQDTIYFQDDLIIIAVVNEVGSDVIKYTLWDNPNGTQFIIGKDKLKSIRFHNNELLDIKLATDNSQKSKLDSSFQIKSITLLDVRKSNYRKLYNLVNNNPAVFKRPGLLKDINAIRKSKITANVTRIFGIYFLAVGHAAGLILGAMDDMGQKELISIISINLLGVVCLTTAIISSRKLQKRRLKFIDSFNL